MITKDMWHEYLLDYRFYNTNNIHCLSNFEMYIRLLVFMFLTPITIVMDILILPFEIGYIIFSHIRDKRLSK